MSLRQYDVVRLRTAMPPSRLPKGATGAVVMVYEQPPAYEVEFCDTDGGTIALLTLKDDDLELVR